MASIKYPRQIDCVKRTKIIEATGQVEYKTLSLEAELYPPDIEKGENPLEMHRSFSRFVVTIVQSSADRKISPWANIPVGDFAYIRENIRLYRMIAKLQQGQSIGSSKGRTITDDIAYTEKIRIGEFRGMTPVAVLQQSSANAEKLARARDFLVSKSTQYQGNATQIQAIESALKLYESGQLDGTEVPVSQYEIYHEPIKPLLRKKRSTDQYCPVYSIRIIYDPSLKEPFEISIRNCYAPVDQSNKPVMSKAVESVVSSINLTEKEMIRIIDRMERTIDSFEMLQARSMWEIAKQNSWSHPDNI